MKDSAAFATSQATSPGVSQLSSASASSRAGAVRCGSWDLDLAHAGDGCALSDEEGQELECVRFCCGIHGPPDVVSARAAGGERPSVAEWTLFAFEGGECEAALVRMVAVVKEVAGHEPILRLGGHDNIRQPP